MGCEKAVPNCGYGAQKILTETWRNLITLLWTRCCVGTRVHKFQECIKLSSQLEIAEKTLTLKIFVPRSFATSNLQHYRISAQNSNFEFPNIVEVLRNIFYVELHTPIVTIRINLGQALCKCLTGSHSSGHWALPIVIFVLLVVATRNARQHVDCSQSLPNCFRNACASRVSLRDRSALL